MPITAVPAFTDGTVIPAATMNALSLDIDSVAQAVLGRATASGALARPSIKVFLLAPQVLQNRALVPVSFGGASVNNDNMWFNPSGPVVTVRTPGWYRIKGQVAYSSAVGDWRTTRILINGTADSNVVASSEVQMGTPSPNNHRGQVRAYEHLPVGATIQLAAFQASGAPLSLLPLTTWGTWLSATWDQPY